MWRIERDNDVGPMDESFWEWWNITDGKQVFRADEKGDAEWLCALLNKQQEGDE